MPSIRYIAPTDNHHVKHVILSVMTDFGCIGEGFSSSDPELHDMYVHYSHDKAVFYVVVDDYDQVKGCGGIGPLIGADPTVCELKKMYFLDELRGQGLGQILMDECLNAARAMGYKECYLETLESMVAANHLYQKNGFVKLTHRMGATGHSGCDAYYVLGL